ncbi:MAG: NUDIX domain-containing protein [Pseudomonadota bacterium]
MEGVTPAPPDAGRYLCPSGGAVYRSRDVVEPVLESKLELAAKPGYDIAMPVKRSSRQAKTRPKSAAALRPNVCMLVYNRKGQLFLGERLGQPGHWQFPQGGVEPGEALKANVLRELREEIGISKEQIGAIVKLRARHSYLWKRIPSYAKGRWVGQKQTFWLVEFIGRDGDIDLASAEEPEFNRWRWCSVGVVRRLAAAERLPGYEKALEEFLEYVASGALISKLRHHRR